MLRKIQQHLEAINGLTNQARAEAFVVDPDVANQLGSTGTADEELLVSHSEADDTLELALYFAPHLLARMNAHEAVPVNTVLDTELNGYCQLTEGVSHFLYMVHSASLGRTVSLLELEAQAEVDKFATCLLHRWGDGVDDWSQELFRRLFDDVSYRESLNGPEQWRYREANRLSRNFCGRLLPHVKTRRLDKLLTQLRYAYRLGAEAKLAHLSQAM